VIRFLALILCVSALAVSAGCQNTVQGFGQDLEKAGKKIQGDPNAKTNANTSTATTTRSTTTYSSSPTYGDVY